MIALDFVIRLQHVMVHAVPLLWPLHRVRHSVEDDECNTNFGVSLTWWYRLFGTYRAQARAPQENMAIGLHDHSDPSEVARLGGMLRMPFKTQADGHAINRRQWHDETSAPYTRP